ncbi:hypothetical protein BX600DRAFT_506739 [Xylariales sp. PMI_506]|nr:hypothetical protein BX600DRAFT_506739 [Xylariales sp. PMI_506]
MGSFSRTQSPVLAMPPSAAHQSVFGMPMFSHQSSPLSRPQSFGAPAMRPQPLQSAGRKRSRDEASINLDIEEAKLETIEPVKEPEDEWVYGEGMVLIKSPLAYVADAGSQSGTWVEETASADATRRNEEARAIHQQARPSLRSNKSQRLDMNAVSLASSDRSNPICDTQEVSIATGMSADASSQPIIDNFTLHLGIGWSRIGNDEHLQAAARGWARYIENHFPVTNAQIRLESKGLQSYLVEATQGYFLFSEDLRQGQLVSRDLGQTIQNLKVSPPVFEGTEVLTAAATTPQPTPQDVDMAMA